MLFSGVISLVTPTFPGFLLEQIVIIVVELLGFLLDINSGVKLTWFVQMNGPNLITMPISYTSIYSYVFCKQANISDASGVVDVRNYFCRRYSNSQLYNNYIDNIPYLFIAIGY